MRSIRSVPRRRHRRAISWMRRADSGLPRGRVRCLKRPMEDAEGGRVSGPPTRSYRDPEGNSGRAERPLCFTVAEVTPTESTGTPIEPFTGGGREGIMGRRDPLCGGAAWHLAGRYALVTGNKDRRALGRLLSGLFFDYCRPTLDGTASGLIGRR